MKKSSEFFRGHWHIRLIIVALAAILLAVSLIWTEQINFALGLKKVTQSQYDGPSIDETLGESASLGELNVHFVDVGQGDAVILELPDGKYALIDAGDNKTQNKERLLSAIASIDEGALKVFDYIILTHADSDHCGGMDEVLSEYPARVFYRPNELASYSGFTDPGKNNLLGQYSAHNTAAYKAAIEAAYQVPQEYGFTPQVIVTNALDNTQNIIAPQGVDKASAEYYSLSFYSPTSYSYKDRNDYSPIIILEYRGKKISLTGDAEKTAEEEFVANVKAAGGKTPEQDRFARFDESFTVNLLKAGHHGSRTSTTDGFIDAITAPENAAEIYVIVSCGADNSYGHPHKEFLDRLQSKNFDTKKILRTDINGTIVTSVKGDGSMTVGTDIVREVKATINLGFDYTYPELALSIFLAIALALLVVPALNLLRRRMRKDTRKKGGSRRR